MRGLILALCLLAGQAWGAYAPYTTALYDLEQNLTDLTGISGAGTQVDAITYVTSPGVWHGTYATSTGSFTVPTGALSGVSTGTVEMSFRAYSLSNSTCLVSIATGSSSRNQEIYYFSGSLYAYGNGANGTNTSFFAVSSNTSYYIKNTWSGTSRQIWAGAWTTAGVVTLTKVFDSTGNDANTASTIYIGGNSFGNGPSGGFDWVRFRNVHDNTATVTVDNTTSAPVLQSPYIKNILYPRLRPNVTGIFEILFCPKQASAMVADQEGQRIQNEWINKLELMKKSTKTPTPKPTATPNKLFTPTPTATPTPKI